MAQNKTWCLLLIAIQLCCLLTPSNAFHMFGGGGGDDGSDVAEILAAGLITKMLMEDFGGMGGGGGSSGRSMFQTLRHQVTSRFNLRAPTRHHMMVHPRPAYPPHMIAPRRPPMMHPYPVPPHIIHRHHQYMMNQAMMRQAAHQQALATAWNNEYRALHESESYVRAYVPVLPTFDELLSDEDTLSAVTILLNSDLLDTEEEEAEEAKEVPQPKEQEEEKEEEREFEVASSDHESRYILPRIVRHFVQRIMSRVEHGNGSVL